MDVSDATFALALFRFERMGGELAELPIAARRALDHAGLRLSLEAWRGLPLDERRRIVVAGAHEIVDTGSVVVAVRRAAPAPQPIERVPDPEPTSPPIGISRMLGGSRSVEARAWSRLRALDRYALAHAHRRAVARNDPGVLSEAYDAIVVRGISVPPAAGASSPPHAPGEPARRSAPPAEPARRSPPPAEPARRSAPPAEPARRSAPPVQPASAPPPPVALEVEAAQPPPTGRRALESHPLSTHLTAAGEVRMVDVAEKPITHRRAVASGCVRMRKETLARLGRHDTPKGEVLATARVAGIMAAKRTHELVPLCHAVGLTNVTIHMDLDTGGARVDVTAIAEADGKTGVEMEALVAVSVACLTIYDMLKGIDRDMVLTEVKLVEKSGGRSGHYRRDPP